MTTPDYQSFFLNARTAGDNIRLKVDLVHDRAPHYGEFAYHSTLGKIDSWRNILSNKLVALYRYEPKDVIDIWMIARRYKFDWQEIIAEAKTKDAAVDPIDMAEIIRSLPVQKIETIKFITPQSATTIHDQLQSLAEDIFYGRKSKGLNY